MTHQEEKILELVSSDDLTEMMIGVEMLKQFKALECWELLNKCQKNRFWERYKGILLSIYPNYFSKDHSLLGYGWDDQIKTWVRKCPDLRHDPKWKMELTVVDTDHSTIYRQLGIDFKWAQGVDHGSSWNSR
jgi:RNA polymerase subunit RPABC4/transcription elongation factor Spt4